VRDAAATLLATYARSKSLGAIAKAIVSDASEISLKGAVAMCKSIERGLSESKDSRRELASFLEPIQEMITEEMPTLDAYGARCLIASTRGLGSSAVKAEVLIPALEWAMNAMTASSVAKAALAVEIIQVFDVEYAKTLGKNGGDAWALLLRCMTLPSPSAVRAAAFGVITPDLVHVLKEDAKSQLFKVLFTAVNADPEDVSRRQAQVAVDSLVIDAKDVVKTLRAAMQQTPAATPAKKKGKSAAAKQAAESFTTSKEAVQAAVTALEILSWKLDKTDNVEVLVEPCQEFLTALMNTTAARAKNPDDDDDDDSDYEASDDEESGVAAGGYIEALVLRTMESLAASGVGGDSWDVKLIIRAVREVEEGAARSAALACLAQIAHVAPNAVLENVFEVSSVLSDRAAASDDVLSQRALENALVAVVPVWLSSGESLTNVVSRLIDSLPSAPPRRRAPICAALIRAAPEGEALPAIILNLLRQCKNLEASARDIRAQTRAVVDASDVPLDDDKWVMELLGALLVRETPFAAVGALVTALKVRFFLLFFIYVVARAFQ
jgi:U3 small nucleolar RNA-associated protein 10